MYKQQEELTIIYRMLGMTFFLFVLWLLLSWTGATSHLETAIRNVLPRWVVIFNLILAPCITAIAAGPLPIPSSVRLFAATLVLLCMLILEITFRLYVAASCVVLVMVLSEAYWIIPRWNARHRGGA